MKRVILLESVRATSAFDGRKSQTKPADGEERRSKNARREIKESGSEGLRQHQPNNA